jgi:hypothetical protein
MKVAAPLALLLLFQGCDVPAPDQKKATAPHETPEASRPEPHRFILMASGVDVAFDTQTGQICRTWDWESLEGQVKAKPEIRTTPEGTKYTIDEVPQGGPAKRLGPATAAGSSQRKVGEFAPTCLSLYKTLRSGGGVAVPTAQGGTAVWK